MATHSLRTPFTSSLPLFSSVPQAPCFSFLECTNVIQLHPCYHCRFKYLGTSVISAPIIRSSCQKRVFIQRTESCLNHKAGCRLPGVIEQSLLGLMWLGLPSKIEEIISINSDEKYEQLLDEKPMACGCRFYRFLS